DGPAARIARTLGHFPDLEPIDAPAIGKAQQVVVRVGDEQLVDPVVFLGGGGLLATAAALLGPVLGQRLALDVAAARQRHHHVHGGDEVLGLELGGVVFDFRAAAVVAGVGEFRADRLQFIADDRGDPFRTGQDVQQIGDGVHDLAVFAHDLVLL